MEQDYNNILFTEYPDVLSIKELQKALKIKDNKAYNLIKSNKIKSFKLGNQILIPKVFLIEFVINSCYNDDNKIILQTSSDDEMEGLCE